MRRTVGKWIYFFIFFCCVSVTAFLIWKENVPAKEIVVTVNDSAAASLIDDAQLVCVDINTADAETLQLLPGIGPVIAERIVAYREGHGSFRSTDHLKKVSGIGEKTYEKIEDLVIAGGNK